jgi:transcriptional regulator with XRE-family HTH domain
MVRGPLNEDIQEVLGKRPEVRERIRNNGARWHLSRQLVLARRRAGLSQRQLAETTGMDQAQISRMEAVTTSKPSDESLRRYLEGCGLVLGYVWGEMQSGDLHVTGAVALGGSPDAEERFEQLIDHDIAALTSKV